ncbi:hypothetical protein K435DRAFT_784805 [Dendrothele bispora CBS 962.96]|uniref:Alpha/beta hydrolase fold-3 domain-containing protein n=1 Tax=Dendrothele bispora (strain CBS 962.96) TaxID=1314807 RepID=A0A4S8L0R7_DENBC|nr:hypothetical protein K435DRAFT_784805 [Dendrothele bispora CBS 962.96]
MTEADRHDPVLTIPLTAHVAKAWAGLLGSEHQLRSQWTLDRPELSPNLVENTKFAKLRDGGVRIHGVVGTFDVLAPDAMVFYERCRENEVEGEWLKWEGQMHCFPLAWKYGLFEGNEGLRWIVNVLERSVA